MSCATGTGHNHGQPTLASLLGEADHLQRRAVRREHAYLHRHPQLFQHLDGRVEAGKVGITAHDDGNPGRRTWINGGGWQLGHRQEPEGQRDCHRPAPA